MEDPLEIHSMLFGQRNHPILQDLFQIKFDINFNSFLSKNQLSLAQIFHIPIFHPTPSRIVRKIFFQP
ncbi:hypothetical protein Y032_0168g170 [Ancylostoma ceylanicum]|uniref:Uncharacterized protein n=1 Tax=Ancylostoma ceylanicum TaxID=53326 RepID=A0A016SVY0_9BILA|nr:hypothetical protein Y032_0168g170 [Ancylostoma ceylanicum]